MLQCWNKISNRTLNENLFKIFWEKQDILNILNKKSFFLYIYVWMFDYNSVAQYSGWMHYHESVYRALMLTREWPCMHASLAVLPVTEMPAEICHYYWLMLFLSPPHQGPALHARRIHAPTWVCACSSGRTSPATAPWLLTLAPSAMTVSGSVTLYFADCNIKLIFGVALSLKIKKASNEVVKGNGKRTEIL